MHKPYVPLFFPTATDFCSTLILVENACTFGAEKAFLGKRKEHRSQGSWIEKCADTAGWGKSNLVHVGHTQDTISVAASSLVPSLVTGFAAKRTRMGLSLEKYYMELPIHLCSCVGFSAPLLWTESLKTTALSQSWINHDSFRFSESFRSGRYDHPSHPWGTGRTGVERSKGRFTFTLHWCMLGIGE